MKLGLINSVWLGTPISTARGIQLTREIGFDTIDLIADPLDLSPFKLRTIRETCVACDVIAPNDQCKWALEGVRKLGEYTAGLRLAIAVELEPFPLDRQ